MKTRLSTGYLQRTASIILLSVIVYMAGVSATPVHALNPPNDINACYDCHGSYDKVTIGNSDNRPIDAAYRNISTGGFVGSHRKHMPPNYTGTSPTTICSPCHGVAPTTLNHRDGMINFTSNINNSTPPGTYSKATGPRFFSQTSMPVLGTCSNVYCHTDGQTPPTSAPPVTWGGGPLTCTACHGSATATGPSATNLSGKHDAHVNNAAALGTNNSFGCVDCHQKTVANNTTLNATTGTTAHVNKFVDYTGLRAGGSSRYNTSTNQCSNIYCHSNGNATSLVYVNPAVWSSATTYGCNGCHGTGNAIGTPDYANGGAGTATANSHNKHVTEAGITATTGCANCHSRTVDATVAGKLRNYSTLHLNSVENVDFKLIGGKTGAYNGTAKTCSATYCHGTAASPAWGSLSLACNACHSASNVLPGAHNQHWETTTLATSYSLAPINSGDAGNYKFNCSSCHAPGSALAVHSGGLANANGAGQVFFGFTSATRKGSYTYGTTQGNDNGFTWTNGTCASTYCHSNGNGGNPVNTAFTWASPNNTLGCGGCHNKAGDATWSGSASHLKHVTTYSGSNTISCGSCHSLTASSNTALSDKTKHVNKVKDVTFSAWAGGTWSGTTCANTYCHSNGITLTHAAISWTAPPAVNCDSCHGGTAANPPASSPHIKHVGTTAGYKFACVKCHARTVKSTADSTTFATISSVHMHLNKVKDVAFDSTVNGSWNGTTCSATYCHSKGTGGTGQTGDSRPITAGTNPTWSGTLNCGSCHGGGDTTGKPEYVNGTLKTNSHSKHPTDCSRCHYGTTTDGTTIATAANHADRTYDLLQKTGTVFSYTYASTGGTCSGIGVAGAAGSCHFSGNAQWGATLTCAACHDINNLSGAHKRHVGGLNLATIPFYAYTANQSVGTDTDGVTWKAYSFGCANCHPVDRGVYHANDSVQVQLDNRVGVSKVRSLNPVTATTSKAPGAGNLQCLNIYCHSDGKGNYVTTPAWNTTVTVASRCGLCHANSPTGDSHAAHTNYASIHAADIYQGPGYSGKLSTTTVSKTHGDPAQSTTIGCNICHQATVNFARNKYNGSCNSCHSGNTDAAGASRITGLNKHVNGVKDVSFAPVNVISKAQLRPASYASTVWTRSTFKGGPNASGSIDTAKTALSNTMFSNGNCSNISCHNGKAVNWSNDYGKGISCTICHDTL